MKSLFVLMRSPSGLQKLKESIYCLRGPHWKDPQHGSMVRVFVFRHSFLSTRGNDAPDCLVQLGAWPGLEQAALIWCLDFFGSFCLNNAVKGIHVKWGKKCAREESRIGAEGFRGTEYDFQKNVFQFVLWGSCKLRLTVFTRVRLLLRPNHH